MKPPHLSPEFAERFKDPEVARAYRSRPPYPTEMFQILGGLLGGGKGRVLDVGCGTGAIARGIAPLAGAVDAVDFAAPMIEAARSLPGGDRGNITWKLGRIEEVELDPPYSLIVGGQSLHWTDWEVVLPRFRQVLAPDGLVAVVDLKTSSPWDLELQAIIAEFSTNRDYRPYDLVAAWQGLGWFAVKGERVSAPAPFKQETHEYLSFLHSMSSLTRASMGPESARAFDDEVTSMIRKHSQGSLVGFDVYSSVVWGTVESPNSG